MVTVNERRTGELDGAGVRELTPNELRFLRPPGLLVRVLGPHGAGWSIEMLPSRQIVHTSDVKYLAGAALVDPAGLLVSVAEERVPSDAEDVLALIARDERARGSSGLRLRDLDPYFETNPGLANRAGEIREALRTSTRWVRTGHGANLAYIEATSTADEWRQRWAAESLDPQEETEIGAIHALKVELAERSALGHHDAAWLGRLSTIRWMPPEIRTQAKERLLVLLAEPQRRAEAVSSVRDEALLALIDPQRQALSEFLLSALPTSLRVRAAAFECIMRTNQSFSIRSTIAEAVRDSRVRVLAHLSRISHRNLLEVVSAVLRLPPPADDESPEALRHLREALAQAGAVAIPTLLQAVANACSTARPGHIETWLNLIQPESPVDVFEIARALATFDRLSPTSKYPALWPLAMTRDRAADGIVQWFRDEVPDLAIGPVRGPESSDDAHGSRRVDSLWVKRMERDARNAFEAFDRTWLRDQIEILARCLKIRDEEVETWRRLADDPAHAARVIDHDESNKLQADREAILLSVRKQVEGEQRALERAAALLVSETLTAIGRIRESTDAPALSAVETRVEELAVGFKLRAGARVGAVVVAVGGRHLGCEPGQTGTVRVVGIQNSTGEVLVPAKLRPENREG